MVVVAVMVRRAGHCGGGVADWGVWGKGGEHGYPSVLFSSDISDIFILAILIIFLLREAPGLHDLSTIILDSDQFDGGNSFNFQLEGAYWGQRTSSSLIYNQHPLRLRKGITLTIFYLELKTLSPRPRNIENGDSPERYLTRKLF